MMHHSAWSVLFRNGCAGSPNLPKQTIERAVVGEVEKAPQQDCDHARHDDRQVEQPKIEALDNSAGELADSEGDREREDDGDRDFGNGEHEGDPRGLPEIVICHYMLVVAHSDVDGIDNEIPIMEGEPDCPVKGVDEDHRVVGDEQQANDDTQP